MTTASPEERMARLEGSYEQIERRLGLLEQDLRNLRSEMIAGFERVNARIDGVNARIDRLMYWQLGLLGAIAASTVAIVLTR